MPPALVSNEEPVKLKSKIVESCAVLAMEMETDEALDVKFPKGPLPCSRELLSVDESWEHVERKPKFVLRSRGGGNVGPSRTQGLEGVSKAISSAAEQTFVSSLKSSWW